MRIGVIGASSAPNWTKFWTKFQQPTLGSHYLIVEKSVGWSNISRGVLDLAEAIIKVRPQSALSIAS